MRFALLLFLSVWIYCNTCHSDNYRPYLHRTGPGIDNCKAMTPAEKFGWNKDYQLRGLKLIGELKQLNIYDQHLTDLVATGPKTWCDAKYITFTFEKFANRIPTDN